MLLIALLAFALFGGTTAGLYDDPNTVANDMALVQLFEWKWLDIANECETFLSDKGFGGVLTSPITEHAKITNTTNPRPWFERYQPVSYNLDFSRSGGYDDFVDMVTRCNNVSVRVYVDIVANHMTGKYGGEGTGNCTYDYDLLSYPCVPYSASNFHPNCVMNGSDATNMRNCWYSGIADLDQSQESVRQNIVALMNSLIEMGVAGFQINGSQFMWPADLLNIFSRLVDLSLAWFAAGSRPFIFQDIGVEADAVVSTSEYFESGRVTEYLYGKNVGESFRQMNGQQLVNLQNLSANLVSSDEALVFVDNQDTQRGIGIGGESAINFMDQRLYTMASAYMLSSPYGVTRLMSSYDWGTTNNTWMGPPSDGDYNTQSPTFNLEGECIGEWVCEHRWRPITHMVDFRNDVQGTIVENWWDNGANQIAFSRGSLGFIAINNEDYDMDETLYTGLPEGPYCDIISGHPYLTVDYLCTGHSVYVDANGYANITISSSTENEGVLAFHIWA